MSYISKFRNYVAKKIAPAGPRRTFKRAFAGAVGGRKAAGWLAPNTSQNSEVKASFNTLRNRARELGRNNPNATSYLLGLEVNVVGTGIRLQSIVKDQEGNSDQKVNELIESEWKKWCRMESCDVRGMLSFQDIEALIIRTIAETGESPIIRFVYEKCGRSDIRLALQILEADHLDVNFNIPASGGKNEIRMGVEINSWGRPVAYHLLTSHPGDSGFFNSNLEQKRIRVPATDIIHFFKHTRPAQNRAVTWFASTMVTLRQLGEYLDAAVLRKKVEAAIMYFITKEASDVPSTGADGAMDTDVQDNQSVIDVEGGAVVNLNEGENVVSPTISSSSGDGTFIQNAMNSVAAGTGSSSETVSKDFSKTNYSSSRLSLTAERDLYKIIQPWLQKNFHQKTFEKFMLLGHLSSVFDFKDYAKNPEKYDQPRWMSRGYDWVDPYKDVLAEEIELKNGLLTMSDALAARGKDLEETVLQIKKEEDFLKQHGITPAFLIKEIQVQPKNNQGVTEDEKDQN